MAVGGPPTMFDQVTPFKARQPGAHKTPRVDYHRAKVRGDPFTEATNLYIVIGCDQVLSLL